MSDETIQSRIQADMVAAMKAKEAERLSTLRMLKAALMEAKTKKPKDASLAPEEEIEVVQRYVKKRREVMEELRAVGRPELIASEEREIEVCMRYLPAQLGEEEIRGMIRDAIASTGASTAKDMGKVIGVVMGQAKGRADGSAVSRLVREELQR